MPARASLKTRHFRRVFHLENREMSATNDTLALLKGAMPRGSLDDLKKAITYSTGTGLVGIDLQTPAKNLYPVLHPLLDRIPRVGGKTGTATQWRQITGLSGANFQQQIWVPEGQRAANMTIAASNVSAGYVTLGNETNVTVEAVNAARNFEDLLASSVMRCLQQTLINEERAVMFGNKSVALGTPAAAVLAAGGTGATLPAATYSVIVVALTGEGYANSSVSGGVATSANVTGAGPYAQTYTLNGGSSNKSASATQAITLGQSLTATVTPVNGAVAYAWYVGVAGSELLQTITGVNQIVISAPLTTGTQNASAITADNSRNANYAFDGLVTTAFNSGSSYVKTFSAGQKLTASGRGSVVEIDAMLKAMWDQYRVWPTVIWVNSQELNNISTLCLSNASAPLLRVNAQAQGLGSFTAGNVIDFYFNPFGARGGVKIPILLSPYLPPGTLIAWAEDLPSQYQSNETPNVCELHVREEYKTYDWPMTTRAYEHGVYVEEVLAVYAPFALGMITNITSN